MPQFQHQEGDKAILNEVLEEAFNVVKLNIDLLLNSGNTSNVTMKAYA
jgi:hypothetical protein